MFILTLRHSVYFTTATMMSSGTMTLTDKFDVVKDIGDGSFGTVVLAKVKSAGSGIARRGTLVCEVSQVRELSSANKALFLRLQSKP